MNTIEQDIELALSWASLSKLQKQPGEGDGWWHVCYRLAMEIKRLQQQEEDDHYDALERDEKA